MSSPRCAVALCAHAVPHLPTRTHTLTAEPAPRPIRSIASSVPSTHPCSIQHGSRAPYHRRHALLSTRLRQRHLQHAKGRARGGASRAQATLPPHSCVPLPTDKDDPMPREGGGGAGGGAGGRPWPRAKPHAVVGDVSSHSPSQPTPPRTICLPVNRHSHHKTRAPPGSHTTAAMHTQRIHIGPGHHRTPHDQTTWHARSMTARSLP